MNVITTVHYKFQWFKFTDVDNKLKLISVSYINFIIRVDNTQHLQFVRTLSRFSIKIMWHTTSLVLDIINLNQG